MLQGGVQMLVCELALAGLLGHYLGGGGAATLPAPAAAAALALMCLFTLGFAWSWGPLGWLIPAEVWPLDARSAGQALSTCVNFLVVFFTTQYFLAMLCAMRYWAYVFFAAWVAVMTLFAGLLLPETRGVHIEAMPELWAAHPVWRRLATGGGEGGSVGMEMGGRGDGKGLAGSGAAAKAGGRPGKGALGGGGKAGESHNP